MGEQPPYKTVRSPAFFGCQYCLSRCVDPVECDPRGRLQQHTLHVSFCRPYTIKLTLIQWYNGDADASKFETFYVEKVCNASGCDGGTAESFSYAYMSHLFGYRSHYDDGCYQ
jgi:hypothetical protein